MSRAAAVAIRPTTSADLEALVRLTRETTRVSFGPVLGAQAVEAYLGSGDLECFLKDHIDRGWVIVVDEVPAGVAMVEGATIGQLMIDHRRHRRGFGAQLLEHVEARLFEDFKALELQSFAANETANAFYLARGWREVERRPDAETGIPMIVFRKNREDTRREAG